MAAARVAAAFRIERAIVLCILGVSDVDSPLTCEELAIPGVAGRQHAIEEVDPTANALHEVFRSSDAHQVTGPIDWQPVCGVGDELIHSLARLADAQATQRVALEPETDGRVGALVSKILKHTALDDAELRLARVELRRPGRTL